MSSVVTAMHRLALVAACLALPLPVVAQATDAAEAAYERAASLVRDGQGEQGRRIVDSMFVHARPGSPEHARALYWRAALARDAQQAERDYRQLVVEYPTWPDGDRALLALAQIELARNDRERAIAHLARLEREHPGGATRPTAAFWMARIRFEMNDESRACASLDDAARLAPAEAVELRNQIDFYASRCAGVVRDTASRAVAAASAASPAGRQQVPEERAPATAAPRAEPQPQPVPARPQAVAGRFAVQVAAYNSLPEATALVTRLARRNTTGRVVGTTQPYRVWIGDFPTRAAAVTAQRELRERGIHGFVVEQPARP